MFQQSGALFTHTTFIANCLSNNDYITELDNVESTLYRNIRLTDRHKGYFMDNQDWVNRERTAFEKWWGSGDDKNPYYSPMLQCWLAAKRNAMPSTYDQISSICDAYEAGYDMGCEHRNLANPYVEESQQYTAWDIGYQAGADRNPTPESE